MKRWSVAGMAALVGTIALSGCVGDEYKTVVEPKDGPIGAVEDVVGVGNGTTFRFPGAEEAFNASVALDDALPVCYQFATCEPNRHPFPIGIPTGVEVLVYGEVRYDHARRITVEFAVENGEIRSWSWTWPEDGLTKFHATVELSSGSGEILLEVSDLRDEEIPYEGSLHAWSDPSVVDSGGSVRFELDPGANLTVEHVLPPHTEPDDDRQTVGFVLYDSEKQAVVRVADQDSPATVTLPDDVDAGTFVYVPTKYGISIRLQTDADVSSTMERVELVQTYGPPRLIDSPDGITWTEEIDTPPVRIGLYLQSQNVWASTTVAVHVRVESPEGTVVEYDVACPPPPSYCAFPSQSATRQVIVSPTGDGRLVPGTYEFQVERGVSSHTHAGSFLLALPS